MMTTTAMSPPSGRSRRSGTRRLLPAHRGSSRAAGSDVAISWVISLSFHAGLALICAFVWYVAQHELERERNAIIVPNAFEDPAYSENPGGMTNPGAGDLLNQAAQDRLKQAFRSDGWSESVSPSDLSALLGKSGPNEALAILAGSGATIGSGKTGNAADSGSIAAYGSTAGMGNGPRSSFYGTGGNATKIVYILDHSGSMLDNFDFLRMQAQKSVNNLIPVQHFAVIMVSDSAKVIGEGGLKQALPDNKKQFVEAIRQERAEGANDNLLVPFEQAFIKAFAMKPELVYFLTDGKFGDGLISRVNQMNRDKKVHINTIAFVTEEPAYKQQLEQLARENGGTYKFVPERDVAK